MYGVDHGTGWEPHDLHDLATVFRDGSVLHRYKSCTTSHYGNYMIYMIYMI